MTVPATDPSVTYVGNGVTTSFPFLFPTYDASWMKVYADGTLRQLGVDYGVTGVGNAAGGSIDFVGAPVSGTQISISRVLPLQRTTDYQNLGDLLSGTLNRDQDEAIMLIQQLQGIAANALTIPDGLVGTSRYYDGKGLPIRNITAGLGDNDAATVGQARSIAEQLTAGVVGGFGFYQQAGVLPVTRTFQDKMRDAYTVTDFGARGDGTTDALVPVQRVKASSGGPGVIRFPAQFAADSTYRFNSLGNSDLDTMTLDVPAGVTLSLPLSSYTPLKNVNVTRQTRIYWRDILCDYYPSPKITTQRDKTNFIGAGDLRYQKLTAITASGLRFLTVPANVSDTFASDTPTFSDARGYSYTNKPSAAWYGGFVSLKRGETLRGTFGVAGSGQVGIMFRHTNGYSMLACDSASPANNLMSRYIKQTGNAIGVATDTSFPGRGSYNSYNPQSSTWSVRITDNGRAVIALNGRGVTAPVWITTLGDIYEVAFVWGPDNNTSSCSVNDIIIEQNSDPSGLVEIGEVRVFGDSTSDSILGVWTDAFKDMLDHTFGVKLTTITNFAVSGTNSFDVNQSIATNGLGNAYYVVVGIGTNDIQGGSSLASSEANLSSIISQIQGAGRVPIMVLPYMWYGQAQAVTGRGQASLNYDKGAPLRARIARLCAETGAIFVDPTFELPEPKPTYVTTDTFNDPLVRDNLHQSALGYKLYAWAIARAIASAHAQLFKFKDYFCAIQADWMRNGWTRGSNVALFVTDSGRVAIQGNFAAGTTTVGTVIMNLPRWARPIVQMRFPGTCNGVGNLVLLDVATNGDVSIATSPSSMSIVEMNAVSFNAN